jgi:hypothetical protein
MTILSFCEKMQQQVKTQGELLHNLDLISRCSKMINILQDTMSDLHQFTYNYAFENSVEEIKFFKELKPVILSQYYYYRKLFNIALYDSFREMQSKRRYYENELRKLELFTKRNHEFYIYCMTNQTYLDEKFFTRNAIPFSVGIDKTFSTGFDDKLARLLSHELIKADLNDMLHKLDHPSKLSAVSWTGNKTDAVELLVALHASANINEGEAEMKQVIKSFEECFNIKLDNYYDLLKKIRLRKGNRSHFIDLLKDKFTRRLDQMEE